MNAWLIRQYFTVIHQVSEGHFGLSALPNPSLFPASLSVFFCLSLSHMLTQADKKCHSQLKDDSPVREEEEVCETSSVHPYKDVRVVGDPQLHQEGNIP